MRFALVLACLVACAPAGPEGPKAPSSRLKYPLREAGVERLVAAARTHDAAAIQAMFTTDLAFGGAWFTDPVCRATFAAGAVTADKQPALARCLGALPLTADSRTSMHADVALVTYAPGIELELLFGGTVQQPKLRWIGYVSRIEVDDTLPTITQDAFEALRTDHTPIALDDATRKKIDLELADVKLQDKPVFTYFKVCIDATGAVSDVRARMTTSLVAQFAYEQQLQTWNVRPFTIDGVATPVCSLLRVGTPASDAGALPMAAPEARATALHVAPWLFEPRRTAGVKALFPDDDDKVRIQQSGTTALIGVVHYCVGIRGDVESATLMRSTGFAGYDRKLVEGIRKWRFRPLELDGAPVPACSFTVFVYSQR